MQTAKVIQDESQDNRQSEAILEKALLGVVVDITRANPFSRYEVRTKPHSRDFSKMMTEIEVFGDQGTSNTLFVVNGYIRGYKNPCVVGITDRLRLDDYTIRMYKEFLAKCQQAGMSPRSRP